MKQLFENIRGMESAVDSAIILFSTGKDSVVLLDLCVKFIKRIEAVFLYIVPDLEYKNRLLEKYEKKYKIKIHQAPLCDVGNIFREYSRGKIKKIKQIDVENYLRQKFDISFCAYGYKMVDSVFRGGILNAPQVKNGIDYKNRRLFPLARWSDKEVMEYIKRERLFLSPEYHYGFRDINELNPDSLAFLGQKFPGDYKKIMEFYPFLKTAV